MINRFKKTVCVVLASCFAASAFTGCDLSFGKAKKQQEVVERYLNACLEFDYREIASCIDGKDDAFQDLNLESPQREVVELVLSKAEFEVVKVENDRARVSFTAPDVDKALRRGNAAILEMEDLDDVLDDTNKMIDEEFEFDFVKDGKEWLIDPDSTEEFAECIGEIGLEVAPQIGRGTRAVELFDTMMSLMAQGNIDGASTFFTGYGSSGYSAFLDADTSAMMEELYGSIFSRIDYEVEMTSCNDNYVTLQVTGTRADLYGAACAVAAENEEVTVPFLKRHIMFYVSVFNYDYSSGNDDDYLDRYYDYVNALLSFYLDCLDLAEDESFSIEVEVNVAQNGDLTMDEWVLTDIMGDLATPEFADEFYYTALDELLAEGQITQEQYDELYSEGPDYLLI